MDLTETQVSTQQVYDGTLLKVYRDDVLLPNGKKGGREYIKHNGAVCIVAITDDREIIVEKQFRYPLHKVVTEIPAGKLDSADEDHLEAAKREFEEETGFIAEKWTYIGELHPSVAYTTECIWMYIAQDLKKGNRHLDDDEFLNIEKVPFDDFVQMVVDGEITDAKTMAAVLKADKILTK